MTVSDEEVFAYVDGELPPESMARITAAMTKDPALAARIQAQRDLRRLLSGAHAGVLREAVPPERKAAATSAAKPAEVIAFPQPKAKEKTKEKARPARPASPGGRPAPTLRKPPTWAAMAACLVAGLAIGRLALPSPPTADGRSADSPLAVGPLAQALESGVAATVQGPVRLGVTFRDRSGRFCRTFQGQVEGGVACRIDGAWRVLAEVPTTPPPSAERRPAGAPTPVAVMAVVNDMIAGAPLDPAAEAKAVKDRWR